MHQNTLVIGKNSLDSFLRSRVSTIVINRYLLFNKDTFLSTSFHWVECVNLFIYTDIEFFANISFHGHISLLTGQDIDPEVRYR